MNRRDLRRVFRRLLELRRVSLVGTDDTPMVNTGALQQMLIIADALEEIGEPEVAFAYRWAAKHHRWPGVRSLRGMSEADKRSGEKGTKVRDWNVASFEESYPGTTLPDHIMRAIRYDPNKRYGLTHSAFIILARALKACNVTEV